MWHGTPLILVVLYMAQENLNIQVTLKISSLDNDFFVVSIRVLFDVCEQI